VRNITLNAASLAIMLGLASTSSAALINLSQTSLVATPFGDYPYEGPLTTKGRFTLEEGDGFARPVGFRILEDGSMNYGRPELTFVTWNDFSGFNSFIFEEEGTYELGHGNGNDSGILLYFSPQRPYTQNTTERFRLFTDVQYNYEPDYRPDPIRDAYVDVEIRFAPVPEPASLATLGFGALAMLRKRKKA